MGAKLGEKNQEQVLNSRDVGRLHTEAFNQLGEILQDKDVKTVDLMSEVTKITASFCPPKDTTCELNAHKATLSAYGRAGNQPVSFPDYFDTQVKAEMSKMYQSLHNYDGAHYDEVMDELNEIQTELENLDGVDYRSQVAGLNAISIALESTDLWTNAFQKEEHALHRSLVESRAGFRKLEEVDEAVPEDDEEEIDYEAVVLADVNATLFNTIRMIDMIGTGNPFTLLAITPIFFVSILQYAVPASLQAAFPNAIFPEPPN